MRLRDGNPGQKLLLAVLVGAQLFGIALALGGAAARIGKPHPGWYLEDTGQVAPMSPIAASLGLRGGGRLVALNGLEIDGRVPRDRILRSVRRALGERNELVIRHRGELKKVSIAVKRLTPGDVAFSHGGNMALAALFFAVGLFTFALRPWEIATWALLAFCHVCATILWNAFADPFQPRPLLLEAYRTAMGPMLTAAALHLGLAFPAVHPVLLRGRSVVLAIYAGGVANAVLALHAWWSKSEGLWPYVEPVSAGLLLGAVLHFVVRCAVLALRRGDRLVAQRARILLAGALVGGVVPTSARFVGLSFGELDVDPRYAYWPAIAFLWALGRTALRPELMNARVAVRRAIIYGAAVLGLTAATTAISSFSPYAVALLLLPIAYLWPRFERGLDARFYPKRVHMLEHARGLSDEVTEAERVDAALEALARGAARLFDARSAVAVLFRSDSYPEELVVYGEARPQREPALEKEPLIQVVIATRREVFRDQIPIEPLYARIRGESYACLDRLDAEVLVPIEIRDHVVGLLALGPRQGGERYSEFETGVVSALAQGAFQSTVRRIRTVERLRSREREFADLKRFFPETIIEQVMARGGAAELRSHRKRVSVVFADLRGFTAFSEQVEPEELMATLAEYHEAMGRRISEFAGTLERFAGDGFMVFFNDPAEQPDHAVRAAHMSLAMRADVERLRERWSSQGWNIHIGIGIATGYATVGFIGYEGRRDYAVIGAVTNLAARLSDRSAPGEILISAATAAELSGAFELAPAGQFELAGFLRPQPAHRLLAARSRAEWNARSEP
jgi:class 3 adenylate cyclase